MLDGFGSETSARAWVRSLSFSAGLWLLAVVVCAPPSSAVRTPAANMPREHEQLNTEPGQYSYPLAQNPNPVSDIFFLDGKHGWVSGEHGLNHPVLFRTEDGGDTWAELPDDPGIYKLFFLSASQGWALVVDSHRVDAVGLSLYETRDGGK